MSGLALTELVCAVYFTTALGQFPLCFHYIISVRMHISLKLLLTLPPKRWQDVN